MLHEVSDFQYLCFDGVQLDLSSYKRIRFYRCAFNNLNLSGLDFSDCEFDACQMLGVRITKAQRARFYSCYLYKARLGSADLIDAQFVNCDVTGMELTGAKLNLDCYNLSGMKTSDPRDVYKLLYWITGLQSPVSVQLADFLEKIVPQEDRAVLDRAFRRDPR